MSIILIAAVADNNVIGRDNDLPWYIPEDLKHFKKLTSEHTVVMGRNTYESIVSRISKPLPNRKNIVITSQADYEVLDGVVVMTNMDKVIELATKEDVYIIGGNTLYQATLPEADVLEITHVHQEPEGDTYFPKVDWEQWEETAREDHDGFSFVTYKRK